MLPKRIMGIETEFGIIPSQVNDGALRDLLRILYPIQRDANSQFTANGARVYIDTGSHIEYASPECLNAKELVTYDKAGEEILNTLLEKIKERNGEDYFLNKIKFFKNNTDYSGHTYGCHENYLISRESMINPSADEFARKVIPFLVTRPIYCGSGAYYRNIGYLQEGYSAVPGYIISQRAPHITESHSSSTTNSRAIVNLRDEPHADPAKYWRLHLILGDANMSEFSAYLKIGTTYIVLSMIEDDFLETGFLAIKFPVKSLRTIAQDLTCKSAIELEDGRNISSIDIQSCYLEKARQYYSQIREPTEEVKDILKKWDYVLEKIAQDPMLLSKEVEWVIKKRIIEKDMERYGYSWDDDYYKQIQELGESVLCRISDIDLKYHLIDKKGIYNILKYKGLVARIVDDKDIKRAMRFPPKGTRARVRGKFIKFWQKSEKLFWGKFSCEADWGCVSIVRPNYNVANRYIKTFSEIRNPFFTDYRTILKEVKRIIREDR